MSELEIRRLSRLDEFERCVEIQQEIWNYSPQELFPRRAFLLAEKLGGHVLGAFAGSKMFAFNVAYPGYRAGMPYLHSQMLAVLPSFRNAGAGRALKLAQRDIALREGFALIEWTFDPLEIKNAFFNLQRLGAISRRYVRDFYGPSSSPLQGGLPTDRLYAEWWIASDRVAQGIEGRLPEQAAVRTVDVAADVYAWKEAGDVRAAALQHALRAELEEAFADGLVAIGYRRTEQGGGRYLLDAWASPTQRKTGEQP